MPLPLLLCLVVGIADGDTLTARCGEPGAYEQVRVRISAIDAPESKQPFGTVSRQSLAGLCHQQEAKITDRGRDRYKRMIADVECQGQDVALYQVRLGMAWVYDQYAKGYAWLYPHQEDAKANRRGLWVDLDGGTPPVAPWEWRRKK
ncbi:thermonuclease family protein [Corticibacter populi]|uniref:Thermonuclease family protein n=1 Tax=Corticibacter populi TaxID=1550736 RepID=A0A3M6QZT3_9BURK|nr:thermonuclease family protein [Corticibacter populi]RMX08520.1 thermonuclease family protein [Corticibacter populi]RZS35837.1 endonuclease YncB(thermonuclease family) [Corticibacter populi]